MCEVPGRVWSHSGGSLWYGSYCVEICAGYVMVSFASYWLGLVYVEEDIVELNITSLRFYF